MYPDSLFPKSIFPGSLFPPSGTLVPPLDISGFFSTLISNEDNADPFDIDPEQVNFING